MSSSGSVGRLSLFAAALVGACGALVVSSLRPPAVIPVAESDSALLGEMRGLRASQDEVLAALERLTRILEPALAAGADTSGGMLASQREAVPGGKRASAGSELLDTDVEALRTLAVELGELRGFVQEEAAATRELLRTVPAAQESLVEVSERLNQPDWGALGNLEARWRADAEATDKSQYFQSPRDLLEAYGPPTAIYRPKGGMMFHYRAAPEGVPGPSWYFRLQDGIVVEFFLEDETGDEDS